MMRLIMLPVFCLLLGGCARPGVRCDAHLQPINAPAARTPMEKTPAPGGPADAATATAPAAPQAAAASREPGAPPR
jgi:hypothetical protein